jgi:hypothetical protein
MTTHVTSEEPAEFIRASHMLKLSKDLRLAAEQGDHADVVTFARAIVAFVEDKPLQPVRAA